MTNFEGIKVRFIAKAKVDDPGSRVDIEFTPTIPHCSMATLIGLCIRVKLLRSLPDRFKGSFTPHRAVDIRVTPGSHASEFAGNLVSLRLT